MSIEPDRSRDDLAGTLRRLRKAAGLSGERLAARCAISQSKISRIESGQSLPTVVDVDRILVALGVPTDVAAELLDMARAANVEHASDRAIAEMGFWRKQIELAALSESCTIQRHLLPIMLSGLLQLPEYARAALSPVVHTDPDRQVEKAVEARLERQKGLDDTARRFVFLLTEQAIRWRYAERSVMARQCEHLTAISERPNVELRIIPLTANVPLAAMNSFVIYDDRLVISELQASEVVMRDPKDVQHHLAVFDYLLKHALCGTRVTAFLHSVRDDFM